MKKNWVNGESEIDSEVWSLLRLEASSIMSLFIWTKVSNTGPNKAVFLMQFKQLYVQTAEL